MASSGFCLISHGWCNETLHMQSWCRHGQRIQIITVSHSTVYCRPTATHKSQLEKQLQKAAEYLQSEPEMRINMSSRGNEMSGALATRFPTRVPLANSNKYVHKKCCYAYIFEYVGPAARFDWGLKPQLNSKLWDSDCRRASASWAAQGSCKIQGWLHLHVYASHGDLSVQVCHCSRVGVKLCTRVMLG